MKMVLASVLPTPSADAEDGPFSLADYLQLACMGRRSARFMICQGARMIGEAFVQEGVLWSVRDRHGSGEQALQRIMFAPGCKVQAGLIYEDEEPIRDVERNWQHVLLDAARAHDEASKLSPVKVVKQTGIRAKPKVTVDALKPAALQPPPIPIEARGPSEAQSLEEAQSLDEALSPTESESETPQRAGASFEDLYDSAIDAMLERRLEVAHGIFLEAQKLCPEDRRVHGNLVRLKELGIG